MKLERGLFEQCRERLASNHWYRQRFDACPHFMFFLGEAHVSRIQRTKYPFGQRIAYAGFSRNRADWYHSVEELERTAQMIVKTAETNVHLSEDMMQAFLPYQEAFYAECAVIETVNLASLSDQDLLATYERLADVYTSKLLSSPLIDGFALATDKDIAAHIRALLQEQGQEERFADVFSVLTAPTFTSFLAEEELALLKIAEDIAQNPKQEQTKIEQHQKAFFWIQNNYVSDHVLDENFFRKRLQEIDLESISSRKRHLSLQAEQHYTEKQRLMDELSLPEHLRTLLRITDHFAAWQDERKKGTFFATHIFSLLLGEIGRRMGYALEELVYVMPPEMEQVFARSLSHEELRKRYDYCMVLWTPETYEVITDREQIALLDAIGTGEVVKMSEVKGFSACLGTASGIVRVIESAQDIHRVQEGDVLVAVMTRPDYLPAMKKAVAFVTDEGGITSHAAIVAREMSKPCVIGTKCATKVLKDGMRVEVDANKGVVHILFT